MIKYCMILIFRETCILGIDINNDKQIVEMGCEYVSDFEFKVNVKLSSVTLSFILSNIKFIGIVSFQFIIITINQSIDV